MAEARSWSLHHWPRLARRQRSLVPDPKGRALDEIAARQRASDQKRLEEAERRLQTAASSKPVLVQ